MIAAIARELRHLIWAVAVVASVALWGYVELHRPHPPPSASVAPASVAREVQAVIDAGRVLAAARGATPALAAPAAQVVREIPGMRGLSGAEVAQILAALKPPTREAISASSKLVGRVSTSPLPSAPPGMTDAQLSAIYAAARKADADVLADPGTHIATTVSVTREEVAPTRVGSIFAPSGAGLGFAALRRGHFEVDAGAIVRGAHLTPILAPSWLIPHTSLACGPSVAFDHHALVGAACTVHF